jgi:rhodanese-related sulfurtransferase
MREVNLATFAAAHADGAVVIDVREPIEYVTGHVPGARLVPLGQLAMHLPDLPHGKRIYLICASGNRSLSAVGYLTRAGLDAWSVAGGTNAWTQSGRPLVRGTYASAA